ncbi:MAG: metal ABC transporter permease [Acidimicrobiales bacterium]
MAVLTGVLADVLGLGRMLSHSFMRNAFLAGTTIAAAGGAVGYFLVIRNQVFTADALSHAAFTGSLGALALGLDMRLGLFASVLIVAALLGGLGWRGKADDVVIGTVFVWVLGLGVLFLSLFSTNRATANSTAGVGVLFGSIFGLSDGRALVAAVVAALVCAALVFMARPLLFTSIDEAVARARGISVRALAFAFLALVAVTVAEATQAVGALLILGLLAAPAGAARRLTSRPYRAVGVSAAIAVGGTWAGLLLSYELPRVPPSFSIVATLTAAYLATGLATAAAGRRGRRPARPPSIP